jgi:hypothetical protein
MTNLQFFYGAGVVALSRGAAVRAGRITRIPNSPSEPRCLRDTVSQDTVSQDVRARDAQVHTLSRARGTLSRRIGVPAPTISWK